MKKSPTTNVLRDLASRLKEHDVEMSMLRKVLDIQLKRIALLQAEVDLLQTRESLDAPSPLQIQAEPSPDEHQGERSAAPVRFIDRQEVLVSAARGFMWQP
jgi:hypothetical protein